MTFKEFQKICLQTQDTLNDSSLKSVFGMIEVRPRIQLRYTNDCPYKCDITLHFRDSGNSLTTISNTLPLEKIENIINECILSEFGIRILVKNTNGVVRFDPPLGYGYQTLYYITLPYQSNPTPYVSVQDGDAIQNL